MLLPGFVGTELPDWLEARLRDGLGGVCLFGENIVSRAQVRALTDAIRAANPLALIAIDEEGGDVTRLYYDTGSPVSRATRCSAASTTSTSPRRSAHARRARAARGRA